MPDNNDVVCYVYNGTEVVLTGRTADRDLGSPITRGTRKTEQKFIDTLHEITPEDNENGSWKKWVRIEELYQIK